MSDLRKLQIVAGVVMGVMIAGGVLMAKAIMEKETGDVEPGILIAVAASMIIGVLVSYLFSKFKEKRSGNIPEIDERTISVMKNYFMWAFYFILIISAIVSLILFFMDVKTVEVGMLFVYQGALYILIGIGAVIAKKVG